MDFTHYKPRFVLDVYKMTSGALSPLNSAELNKFCLRDQAEGLARMLPGATVVDTLAEDFVGAVYTNYRNDSDPTNLFCLSISVPIKVIDGKDEFGNNIVRDTTIVQNVGELLGVRRNSVHLFINTSNQLAWE